MSANVYFRWAFREIDFACRMKINDEIIKRCKKIYEKRKKKKSQKGRRLWVLTTWKWQKKFSILLEKAGRRKYREINQEDKFDNYDNFQLSKSKELKSLTSKALSSEIDWKLMRWQNSRKRPMTEINRCNEVGSSLSSNVIKTSYFSSPIYASTRTRQLINGNLSSDSSRVYFDNKESAFVEENKDETLSFFLFSQRRRPKDDKWNFPRNSMELKSSIHLLSMEK